MKLQIVDIDIAKDLKELGFNELHNNCYRFDCTEEIYVLVGANGVSYFNNQVDKDGYVADVTAPEQALVVKWFRNIHNVSIEPYIEYMNYWSCKVSTYNNQTGNFVQLIEDFTQCDKLFDTYEKSELEGIKVAIEYLKLKNKIKI